MRTTAFSLELQRAKRILTKVNALAPTMRAMSDQKLKAQTPRMQKMLKDGKSLNSLLPMAFATAREAARRVLGMYPYDVQVIGAIVLHHGWIAEMKTGEGKTLTAALPATLSKWLNWQRSNFGDAQSLSGSARSRRTERAV